MALELSEQHLEILREVRENLRTRLADPDANRSDGSEYICVQILRLLGRRNGVELAKRSKFLSPEGRLQYQEITKAIGNALEQSGSVGIYLNQLELNISVWHRFDIAPVARLAWLDRMIETRVIA